MLHLRLLILLVQKYTLVERLIEVISLLLFLLRYLPLVFASGLSVCIYSPSLSIRRQHILTDERVCLLCANAAADWRCPCPRICFYCYSFH